MSKSDQLLWNFRDVCLIVPNVRLIRSFTVRDSGHSSGARARPVEWFKFFGFPQNPQGFHHVKNPVLTSWNILGIFWGRENRLW